MLIYDGGKFSEPSPCHMSQEEWDHYENAKNHYDSEGSTIS